MEYLRKLSKREFPQPEVLRRVHTPQPFTEYIVKLALKQTIVSVYPIQLSPHASLFAAFPLWGEGDGDMRGRDTPKHVTPIQALTLTIYRTT
jgi:hypothetical protein